MVATGTGLAPYMSMLRTGPPGWSDRRWAVLLGAAVFGERPAATDYLAMAIILAGIALSQRSPSGDVRAPDQVAAPRSSG